MSVVNIKIGKSPIRHTNINNANSWEKITDLFSNRGTVPFSVIAATVEDHIHGTKTSKGGASFVNYCIKRGWLEIA